MTRLPPSPFLSCSGEFPSFSPVDAAASIKPPLRDAAAEIPGASPLKLEVGAERDCSLDQLVADGFDLAAFMEAIEAA